MIDEYISSALLFVLVVFIGFCFFVVVLRLALYIIWRLDKTFISKVLNMPYIDKNGRCVNFDNFKRNYSLSYAVSQDKLYIGYFDCDGIWRDVESHADLVTAFNRVQFLNGGLSK